MDIEAQKGKMKQLFTKARVARDNGSRAAAQSFRAGARRIAREIKAEAIKNGELKKKRKKDEG